MDSTKSGRITEPEFVEWWNGKGDSFHKQLHDSLKAPLHAPWPVRDGLLTYDLPRSFASPNRWIQPKCRRSSRAHEHRDGESSARRACSPGSLRGSTRRESRYIYSCLIACRPVSCRAPSAARYPLSSKVTPLLLQYDFNDSQRRGDNPHPVDCLPPLPPPLPSPLPPLRRG